MEANVFDEMRCGGKEKASYRALAPAGSEATTAYGKGSTSHEKDVSRYNPLANGGVQALAYVPSSSPLPSLRAPGAPMSFVLAESDSALSNETCKAKPD